MVKLFSHTDLDGIGCGILAQQFKLETENIILERLSRTEPMQI